MVSREYNIDSCGGDDAVGQEVIEDKRSDTKEVIAMRLVPVIQWVGFALTALFMGISLYDQAYFIDHHLLAVFAVVMTILEEAGTYLAKVEGRITPRNAMLTSVLLFLVMIAALYVDHVEAHVFHLIY
ncbi:hypothetical protein [Thermococcus sp. Bubb.Bath]|uniref:hypothetical protein n=1 Tax=Thermococcus sp. Bubb.Bath TaxID=1638242 RepID=UPI001439690A|nr:hypothetical protein [Thermococcus sp. Bubb.Bath]NJF25087.1 hypothetical protein [Thermococcus sp. Bubb.Bath]